MNSRYYLTFKSTFQSEKPKKLEKTSLNVKFFDWDYLRLTALMKETYFSIVFIAEPNMTNKFSWSIFSLSYVHWLGTIEDVAVKKNSPFAQFAFAVNCFPSLKNSFSSLASWCLIVASIVFCKGGLISESVLLWL